MAELIPPTLILPTLILPTINLHAAFLDCRDEWGPGLHEDGFGLRTPGSRIR